MSTKQGESMPIILDIDNCIADDAWRIPQIDWRTKDPYLRYHRYHSLAPWDRIKNRNLFAGERCYILTARPILYREMTLEWLERGKVNVLGLLMRNNHDHRSSLDVKRQQVKWLFAHYGVPIGGIKMAYDDRPDIVRMYQTEFQIPAEVAKCHDVSAYHPEELKRGGA